MSDWKIVAAQLKGFDDRREVLKAMRKGLREPVGPIRKAIKARARADLPARGGLNRWVASTRVTAAIKIGARRIEMKLKGGRNSAGGRSDIAAIDRGRVRAPSWGRKGAGQWHTQNVRAGFFTDPAAAAKPQILDAVDDAVDQALDAIRKG